MLIGLAGDVMMGRLVDEHLQAAAPDYLWGDTLTLWRSSDLNLVNLECALTTCNEAVPKVFNFRSDPSHVASLLAASIHVVNLANNHVLDYSEVGLLETLDTLDQAGIDHVGAGKNIEEAAAPVLITRSGVRVAILGYTDNEPTWAATKRRPGTRYLTVRDPYTALSDVEHVKSHADLVIVTIHWGPNMRERPPRSFRMFAHQLIDAGAHLIHGHSAHIFQGVEVYAGGVILYDTGDFVDDYTVDPHLRNDRSFLFLVEASVEGIQSVRLIPTIISHYQARLARGVEAKESLDRMQALSDELGTHLQRKELELEVQLKP